MLGNLVKLSYLIQCFCFVFQLLMMPMLLNKTYVFDKPTSTLCCNSISAHNMLQQRVYKEKSPLGLKAHHARVFAVLHTYAMKGAHFSLATSQEPIRRRSEIDVRPLCRTTFLI